MSENIRHFSGYRIRTLQPELQAGAWAELAGLIPALVPAILPALSEPYFLDDSLRGVEPKDLLIHGLTDGELFLCLDPDSAKYIGIVMLRGILHGRSATIEVYAHPEARASFAGWKRIRRCAEKIIVYAFRPWADGLGLIKIRAEVSTKNEAALRAARGLGFDTIGVSPEDGFFDGKSSDMVLLELLNPDYFSLAVQEPMPSVEEESTSAPADLYATGAVHAPARSAGSGAASDAGATDSDDWQSGGISVAIAVADSGESE